jgi:hypothetical protein
MGIKGFIHAQITRFISKELRSLQFAIGQGAILSSRIHSSNFQDLWDAEVKVYSQWGEDGILDFLCEKLKISKPNVIELGSGDFQECNSRFLFENRNANIFAVDAREDLNSTVTRNNETWKSHLFSKQTWITPDNINALIVEANEIIGFVDILSIDLDGNDFWVLKNADLRGIRIVVVEYNPLFGSTFNVTVPRDDAFDRTIKHSSGLYYGASIQAFIELLRIKGFTFIGTNRVGNNAFFVASEFDEMIPIRPRTDLTVYTDWRIREARSDSGELSLSSGLNRLTEISTLELVNPSNGKLMSVQAAYFGSLKDL